MTPPAPNRRRIALYQGLISLGVFLLGLSIVFEEMDSGRGARLVLGIAVMVCGGIGALLSLWAGLRRPR